LNQVHAEKRAIAAALARHYNELEPVDEDPEDRFSLTRMLYCFAQQRPQTGREKAVLAATDISARLAGDRFLANPNRVFVPLRALTRAMATTPGAKGGYAVGVDTIAPADTLRPWSVVAAAGVDVMFGLTSNVAIPRDTGAPSITWYGPEGGSGPSESPPALGEASLTPRTALALVKFSKQLLEQGAAVDAYVAARLMRAAGEALDVAFFAGSGGAQPLGLLNTSGIGTQSGTSLARAGLVAMRKTTLLAGAQEANLQWVGTPAVQETLANRQDATGTSRFLWDDRGVLGMPATATKNAPASALTVGDFSRAVVGIFGPGIRIDIDPSQDFNSAGLVARVLLFCDVAFPQPAAFTVATSVT
jgi:HK97 family phage major capsid protein